MPKMNLVSKLYQKSVIEKIKAIDWMNGSNSPYVVELDPTTACDLACPGCISGELLNQEKFSKTRLLALAEEFVQEGVKAVILIGGGEPLTHPAIGEVINYFGENMVQVGITTNGTLIDRYISAISEYSNWTRVSVDAATDETFRHLRPTRFGKSKFATVISNMEMLAKKKKGILGYSFLIRTESDGETDSVAGLKEFGKITQSNILEIYDAAKLAKEIGCDYFEAKPSYDDNHYLVIHSKDEMDKAREQLEKARSLEDDSFVIMNSINLEHSLKSQQMGAQPKTYNSCPTSELRTLVTASGVYVCPYFRGREDKKIGDITDQSLAEIWNSDRRKKVMSKLDPSKDCGMHCIRHETNLELIKIQKNLDKIETTHQKNKIQGNEDEDLFI